MEDNCVYNTNVQIIPGKDDRPIDEHAAYVDFLKRKCAEDKAYAKKLIEDCRKQAAFENRR